MIFEYIVAFFHHIDEHIGMLAFRQIVADSLSQHIVGRCKFKLCSTVFPYHAVSVAYACVKLDFIVLKLCLQGFDKLIRLRSCDFSGAVIGYN